MYDSIVEKRSENDDYPGLIDIGSCNLHIVHGTFRTGVQKTKWGIDGILQALYNLFPYSPAKREDYQKLTGSKVFPLPFLVELDGLKTRRWQTELFKYGPTSLNILMRP